MKKSEQSNGQMNVQEMENKSTSLIDVENVEGTPFHIVTNNELETEKKCFIALGNKRLTEYETKEILEDKIINRDWDIILNTIVEISDRVARAINEEKNN